MFSDSDINSDEDFQSDIDSDFDSDNESAVPAASNTPHQRRAPPLSTLISNFRNRNQSPTNNPTTSDETIVDQVNQSNNSTVIIRNPQQLQTGYESDDDVFGSDSDLPDFSRVSTSREEIILSTPDEQDEDDQEVYEQEEDEDVSPVVSLPGDMIYVDGFIVHNNRVKNPYSASFQKNCQPTCREIANRNLRLVKVSDYIESRIIRVEHETLFHYAESQTIYAKYKNDRFSFSEYKSPNSVKMTGVKVFITTRICALIVLGTPEWQQVRIAEEEEESARVINDNSTLNDYYGGLNISDNDKKLVEIPYNEDIVGVGKFVYRTLYEKAIGSAEFSAITSRRWMKDHEGFVNFIREHKPATVDSFCRVFGRMLDRICLGKEFDMINNDIHGEELSLIENIEEKSSTDQVSIVKKLIENFIHNRESLIAVVFPFFLKKDKTNFFSESECLRRINCLKNISKYVKATTRANLMEYEQQIQTKSIEIPGSILANNLFTRLLDNKSTYASINVIAIDKDTCSVGNTKIAKSHLKDLYKEAKNIFEDAWTNICLLCKRKITQSDVYGKFMLNQDFQSQKLLPDMIDLIFDATLVEEKDLALKWIEKATLALMVVIYVSSMNSFRLPELCTLNYKADNFAKRNVVFISSQLIIQTLYNKNKKEDHRFRAYSKEVGTMIIAFLYAIRTLHLSLVESELNTFTSRDFRDEVSGRACFNTYCFVSNSGRLIKPTKFSSFLQSLITSKKIGVRILRQATSYYIKNNFSSLLNQDAADILEGIQGHSTETGLMQYSVDKRSIMTYFSTYKLTATTELFEKWCQYLQLSGKPNSTIYSKKTASKEPEDQGDFGSFDINRLDSAILSQFPDFNFSSFQYKTILQIALCKSKSLFVIAATGAGKTYCVSFPMQLFKRMTSKKWLHVIAVPYLRLKDEMIKRFRKDRFNVLDGVDYQNVIDSTDVVVCSFDLLKKQYFEDFLSIHKERLGFVVLDEAHLIESEGYRKLGLMKASVVDLFRKQIFMTATPLPTTIGCLEDQFKLKFQVINGISDVCDKGVIHEFIEVNTKDLAAKTIQRIKSVLDHKEESICLVYFNTLNSLKSFLDILLLNFNENLVGLIVGEAASCEFNTQFLMLDGKRIILGTKCLTVGLNNSNYYQVIYYNSLIHIGDYIQCTGRLRNNGLSTTYFTKDSKDYYNNNKKNENNKFNPQESVFKRIADFYRLSDDFAISHEVNNEKLIGENQIYKKIVEDLSYQPILKIPVREMIHISGKIREKQSGINRLWDICKPSSKFNKEFDQNEEFLKGVIKIFRSYKESLGGVHSDESDTCEKCYLKTAACNGCNFSTTFEKILSIKLMLNEVNIRNVQEILTERSFEKYLKTGDITFNKLKRYKQMIKNGSGYRISEINQTSDEGFETYVKVLSYLSEIKLMPLYILKHLKNDIAPPSKLNPREHIIQCGTMYGLPKWACTVSAVGMIHFSKFSFGCENCGIKHEGDCAYEYTRELFYVLFFSKVAKDYEANDDNIIFFQHWLEMISTCSRDDGWYGHIHFISKLQFSCNILPNRCKRRLSF
ncbi:uncharacterized protein KGF55_002709 [Candida pseudojiufengensis]|uniref:uncharacterized protein n=1 Tax=Candida pseudojiufengensis TaxID=497109 RepID=UPI0022257159|nr:uncharacterized protein KGF55_002709 [Candida pseudojiufengensis]KAI5963829.1 hypothetical protein KGF55_002709 [Candida pseudojiufengensis]